MNNNLYYAGFEYRSEAELFGWPVIHIASGINPQTGLPHVARGIFAIGNFAVGVVAIGGFALGVFTVAGIGLGIMALGGVAGGFVAVGGLTFAYQFALGGIAFSAQYALGGLTFARHAIDAACSGVKIILPFQCSVKTPVLCAI